MIPFKHLITVDRGTEVPVYLQLHNALVGLIKSGTLKAGSRLPGTRNMAQQINLHRKTVIAAYDELLSQGWITSIASKGTYVSAKLPEIKPKGEGSGTEMEGKAGFAYDPLKHIHRPFPNIPQMLTLDEGIPDVRIAPMSEILRHQRSFISRAYNARHLNYGSVFGNEYLREVLANYLQETRGIQCAAENVLITRGSQMALYLSSQLIHRNGGISAVGDTNYIAANLTLQNAGAIIKKLRVDEKGLMSSELENLLAQESIGSVYVTPHHHHPTTVTLSPERRIHMVELAKKHGFAILEDDYDYDFHYQRAPLLPLASMDDSNHIIYMGALCKIVAPTVRVGYMVGPKDFIEAAGHFRRTIDRQGDTLLERAIGQMIEMGDLQRHSRKALKLYHERRDHFNHLLKQHLGEFFSYDLPEGGMAFWAKLDKALSWEKITHRCHELGLVIPDWKIYDHSNQGHNGIRMGFASLNFEEQEKVIAILKSAIEKSIN